MGPKIGMFLYVFLFVLFLIESLASAQKQAREKQQATQILITDARKEYMTKLINTIMFTIMVV